VATVAELADWLAGTCGVPRGALGLGGSA
jgi:hypothetical protein